MIYTKSTDRRIINATNKVITLFNDVAFLDYMKSIEIDMADVSSTKVAELTLGWMKIENIGVTTFRPCYRWSKAIAKFDRRRPDIVQLNSRKLNRNWDKDINEASIAGSIVHEIIHLVDNKFKDFSFGHAGNSSKGKENTAPYRWGREAKKWILKNY